MMKSFLIILLVYHGLNCLHAYPYEDEIIQDVKRYSQQFSEIFLNDLSLLNERYQEKFIYLNKTNNELLELNSLPPFINMYSPFSLDTNFLSSLGLSIKSFDFITIILQFDTFMFEKKSTHQINSFSPITLERSNEENDFDNYLTLINSKDDNKYKAIDFIFQFYKEKIINVSSVGIRNDYSQILNQIQIKDCTNDFKTSTLDSVLNDDFNIKIMRFQLHNISELTNISRNIFQENQRLNNFGISATSKAKFLYNTYDMAIEQTLERSEENAAEILENIIVKIKRQIDTIENDLNSNLVRKDNFYFPSNSTFTYRDYRYIAANNLYNKRDHLQTLTYFENEEDWFFSRSSMSLFSTYKDLNKFTGFLGGYSNEQLQFNLNTQTSYIEKAFNGGVLRFHFKVNSNSSHTQGNLEIYQVRIPDYYVVSKYTLGVANELNTIIAFSLSELYLEMVEYDLPLNSQVLTLNTDAVIKLKFNIPSKVYTFARYSVSNPILRVQTNPDGSQQQTVQFQTVIRTENQGSGDSVVFDLPEESFRSQGLINNQECNSTTVTRMGMLSMRDCLIHSSSYETNLPMSFIGGESEWGIYLDDSDRYQSSFDNDYFEIINETPDLLIFDLLKFNKGDIYTNPAIDSIVDELLNLAQQIQNLQDEVKNLEDYVTQTGPIWEKLLSFGLDLVGTFFPIASSLATEIDSMAKPVLKSIGRINAYEEGSFADDLINSLKDFKYTKEYSPPRALESSSKFSYMSNLRKTSFIDDAYKSKSINKLLINDFKETDVFQLSNANPAINMKMQNLYFEKYKSVIENKLNIKTLPVGSVSVHKSPIESSPGANSITKFLSETSKGTKGGKGIISNEAYTYPFHTFVSTNMFEYNLEGEVLYNVRIFGVAEPSVIGATNMKNPRVKLGFVKKSYKITENNELELLNWNEIKDATGKNLYTENDIEELFKAVLNKNTKVDSSISPNEKWKIIDKITTNRIVSNEIIDYAPINNLPFHETIDDLLFFSPFGNSLQYNLIKNNCQKFAKGFSRLLSQGIFDEQLFGPDLREFVYQMQDRANKIFSGPGYSRVYDVLFIIADIPNYLKDSFVNFKKFIMS